MRNWRIPMANVIVIGAGAAGMMAAYAASLCGHQVLILEKNEKAGKKIYITGKGRCNLTNASDLETIFASIVHNGKFMYSSLYTFDNQAVMDFFITNGLEIKTERGNRVFPQSDHSSDVIRTLVQVLKKQGVETRLHAEVTDLVQKDGKITGVKVRSGKKQEMLSADAVICTCGGQSYPSTGSDGNGYRLAASCGHTIQTPTPALVPLVTKESYIPQLQGLSLKNVSVTICRGKKKLYEEFGEMLFTHFGVSGPLILSASSIISDALEKGSLSMEIDLKPALTEEQLDHRIQRDFQNNLNKAFKNAITGLLPAKLLPVIIELSGIDGDRKVNSITKEERMTLIRLLKAFPCTIIGKRGWNEAIITRGGISVKEVNPSTMESKLVKGLYFAGEILDVDALTGGYNLQIAWSTGYLAGISIEC